MKCKVEDVNWSLSVPEVFGNKDGGSSIGFDLLACDMNGMDPRDLMRLMIELTAFVKPSPDAMLVVTLKLPAKVSESQRQPSDVCIVCIVVF